ncbi:MAG TPA: MFS transporter [Caulobacteraceae bacterium]|jgi:GPH family glycoside/pentoside/hexuronide:cation symporter|nr:MFS transporter [Caulobacteraceae bacterium]
MTALADKAPDAAAEPGAAHAERARPLGLPLLGVYGSGALVEVMINFALGQFLLFYLTIACGLPGAFAGVVGLLSLTIDAVIDPLVGSLSDNLRGRLGRRHPFLIGAAPPTALIMILLFSLPLGLGGGALFIYATALSLALRIGLSCFQVPYYALGAELSDNYAERSTIVGFRVGFGVIGTLLATALSYGLFLAPPGATTHRAAYVPMAWSFAAVIAGAGLFSGFGTLATRGRLHRAASLGGAGGLRRLATEISEIFRNRSFRVLFSAILLFFVAQGVATPLTLYANTYFWKISTVQIRDLTFIYTGGLAVGIVITGLLSRRLEKRTVAFIGLACFLLSQLLPAPLRILGLLPTKNAVMLALTVAVILLGMGSSAAIIGYQSMMADAADEHEHLFGARREGLYFAGINFSAKASSGLGALIAGLALDAIGFPHGAGALAAKVPPRAVTELALIYGPGAAVVSFVSVTILFAYRINRRRHGEIIAALGRKGPA